MKFGFDSTSGLIEKMFENNGHINVNSPGSGADNHWGQIIFRKINYFFLIGDFPI